MVGLGVFERGFFRALAQTVKKLSRQRSDKGSRIYRSETNGFDSRKATVPKYITEDYYGKNDWRNY